MRLFGKRLRTPRFAIRRRKNVTVMKIVKRLMFTLIGLYAGGLIYTTFGTFMNGTCSPFYTGFQLIGWTVAAPATQFPAGAGTTAAGCANSTIHTVVSTTPTTVTLLGIAGLIALISVVTSIFSMKVR